MDGGQDLAVSSGDSVETTDTTFVAVKTSMRGTLPVFIDGGRELRWSRSLYACLAVAIALFFFFNSMAYWTPANGGVDQNGYLVGGKNFARTLSMRMAPVRPGTENVFDPYQFVGLMWIGTDYGKPTEAYYPKYPLGYPLLVAIAIWCAPAAWNVWAVYMINPVATLAATTMLFFLARKFMHSLPALLAMIAFASSPVTQGLTWSPNSHATATFCVTGGMLALVSWWQSRGTWRAVLGGLLLGYAFTIRYTEGALILPLLVIALCNMRWREWRSWRETMWLGASWLLPVGSLLVLNYMQMGSFTGYGPTNESVGFKWEYAVDNWETLLRQLNTFGLSYLFPLAMAGLVWMFWWNWRVATWLAAWTVPCLITYLFYYWAPNPQPNPSRPMQQFDVVYISYTRFFLTILPGLSLIAFWMVDRIILLGSRWTARRGAWRVIATLATLLIATGGALALDRWLLDATPLAALRLHPRFPAISSVVAEGATALAVGTVIASVVAAAVYGRAALATIGAGVLTAVVLAMQMDLSLVSIENAQIEEGNLETSVDEIRSAAPQGSVLFNGDPALFNHIQMACDYTLYQGQPFQQGYIQGLPLPKNTQADPQGLDPGRRQALFDRLHTFDQPMLDQEERSIIEQSLDSNRRVFVIVPRRDGPNASKKLPVVNNRSNRNTLRVGTTSAAAKVKMQEPFNRVLTDDKFDTEVVATWTRNKPRPLPQGVSRSRGVWAGAPMDRSVEWFQLLEVTRKAPAVPKPVESKPASPKPATVPTTRLTSAATKPVPTKPAATKPVATKPAATKPASTTSAATNPQTRPATRPASRPA